MTFIGSVLSSSPRLMMAPFPNCFSIPATMVRMARSFSAMSNMRHFPSWLLLVSSRTVSREWRMLVHVAVEDATLYGLGHVGRADGGGTPAIGHGGRHPEQPARGARR